jgi:hypothetical protein
MKIRPDRDWRKILPPFALGPKFAGLRYDARCLYSMLVCHADRKTGSVTTGRMVIGDYAGIACSASLRERPAVATAAVELMQAGLLEESGDPLQASVAYRLSDFLETQHRPSLSDPTYQEWRKNWGDKPFAKITQTDALWGLDSYGEITCMLELIRVCIAPAASNPGEPRGKPGELQFGTFGKLARKHLKAPNPSTIEKIRRHILALEKAGLVELTPGRLAITNFDRFMPAVAGGATSASGGSGPDDASQNTGHDAPAPTSLTTKPHESHTEKEANPPELLGVNDRGVSSAAQTAPSTEQSHETLIEKCVKSAESFNPDDRGVSDAAIAESFGDAHANHTKPHENHTKSHETLIEKCVKSAESFNPDDRDWPLASGLRRETPERARSHEAPSTTTTVAGSTTEPDSLSPNGSPETEPEALPPAPTPAVSPETPPPRSPQADRGHQGPAAQSRRGYSAAYESAWTAYVSATMFDHGKPEAFEAWLGESSKVGGERELLGLLVASLEWRRRKDKFWKDGIGIPSFAKYLRGERYRLPGSAATTGTQAPVARQGVDELEAARRKREEAKRVTDQAPVFALARLCKDALRGDPVAFASPMPPLPNPDAVRELIRAELRAFAERFRERHPDLSGAELRASAPLFYRQGMPEPSIAAEESPGAEPSAESPAVSARSMANAMVRKPAARAESSSSTRPASATAAAGGPPAEASRAPSPADEADDPLDADNPLDLLTRLAQSKSFDPGGNRGGGR